MNYFLTVSKIIKENYKKLNKIIINTVTYFIKFVYTKPND